MKTVYILKSDIDDAEYDSVLTAIDIEASDLEPGDERELRVIIQNDDEPEEEQDEELEEQDVPEKTTEPEKKDNV